MPARKQRKQVENSGKGLGIVLGLVTIAAAGVLTAGVFQAPKETTERVALSIMGRSTEKETAEPEPVPQKADKPEPEKRKPAKKAEYLVVEDGVVRLQGQVFRAVGMRYKYGGEPVSFIFRPGTYTTSIRSAMGRKLQAIGETGCNTVVFPVPYKMPEVITDCALHLPVAFRPHRIAEGHALEYSIQFPRDSASARAGLGFELDNGKRLMDLDLKDTQDRPASPAYKFPDTARGGPWMKRRIPLKGLAGRRIVKWFVVLEGDKPGRQAVRVQNIHVIDTDFDSTIFELHQDNIIEPKPDDPDLKSPGYREFSLELQAQGTVQVTGICTGPRDPTEIRDAVVDYDPQGGPPKYLAGVTSDFVLLARQHKVESVINILADGPEDKFSDTGRQASMTWIENFCREMADTEEVLGFNVGDGAPLLDAAGDADKKVVQWLQYMVATLRRTRPESLVCVTLQGQSKKLGELANEIGREADVLIIQPTVLPDDFPAVLTAVSDAHAGRKPVWVDFSYVLTRGAAPEFSSFKERAQKLFAAQDAPEALQGTIIGPYEQVEPMLPESPDLKELLFQPAPKPVPKAEEEPEPAPDAEDEAPKPE